jgi:hypothetical protein
MIVESGIVSGKPRKFIKERDCWLAPVPSSDLIGYTIAAISES